MPGVPHFVYTDHTVRANLHYLRSAVWFGGVACVSLLMIQAALAIA